MRIDIAESIREVLSDKLPVSITGLGTLLLKHIPAKFGDKRQSILPPSVELCLEPTKVTSSALREQLILKHGIKENEAQKYIKGFNEQIINAIVNYGQVRINGIGVFSKTPSGQIELNVDEKFITAFYKGLPEVKAVVVKKSGESSIGTTTPLAPPPPIQTKKEDSFISDKAIEKAQKPIPVFDLPDDANPKSANDVNKPELQTANPKPEYKTAPAKTTVKESIETPQKKVYPKSDYDYSPGCVRPILYVLGFLLIMFLLFKGCSTILNLKDGSTISSTSSSTLVGEDKNSDTQTIDPFKDADVTDPTTKDFIPAEELNEVIDRPDKCIIITGTFASTRNVSRMQNWIADEGYEVYNEAYGPYTRVGFKFECADVDLEEYLQNVRRIFDRESWYLDPSLYVPHED